VNVESGSGALDRNNEEWKSTLGTGSLGIYPKLCESQGAVHEGNFMEKGYFAKVDQSSVKFGGSLHERDDMDNGMNENMARHLQIVDP
jgi:hypothetical protein